MLESLKKFMLALCLLAIASFDALGNVPACIKREGNKSNKQAIEEKQITDNELLSRLVYAEALSTNAISNSDCRKVEPQIFEAIAWGVLNRVQLSALSSRKAKRYGVGISGVIFKRGQFNPAISKKSRYSKFFLCPQLSSRFRKAWPMATAATKAVRRGVKNPFLKLSWEKQNRVSLVNQFYYPLSTQATPKPPRWADASPNSKSLVSPLVVSGKTIPRKCIWFFRNERPFSIEKPKQP